MQLADLEDIHLRYRQLYKNLERLGQQRGGAAHGDVGDLAQGIAEIDFQFIQHRRLGDGAWRRLEIEQGQFEQCGAQYLGIGRLLDKGQSTELLDPSYGFFLHVTGNHHNLAGQAFGAQRSEGFVTIHDWHGQVQQHYLAQPLTQRGKSFLAIGGLADGDWPFRRQGAYQLLARHVRVVADH